MQNAAFNSLNLNCTYIAFKVPHDELSQSIESLRSIGIAGFNVTIPHKVSVMKYLDELDVSAKKAAAVNTVVNIEGIFKGYNTDIDGFIEPLRRRKVDFQGMQVLLIGAGGAARAVVAALSGEQGIAVVSIANRDILRSRGLAEIASNLGLNCQAIPLDNIEQAAPQADMIINATSIGMKNEPSIIDSKLIKKGTIVYEIVYRPITTELIENAKYAQAIVVYGYEMLIEQGARAFELWTGIPAPRDVMKKSLLGMFGEPS
jgi:shikimate dehydrogenase